MKVKYLPLVLGVLALLFASCDDIAADRIPVYGGPGGGDNGKFYAQNMVNNKYYELYADKLFDEEDDVDTMCTVWAENGSGVTKEYAVEIANEYNNRIYPKMLDAFGDIKSFDDPFTEEKGIAGNTMEFADYLGNGDGKLCILLLKTKDGYNPPKNNSYIAGYFTALNFYRYEPGDYDTYYSNECDMIYLDVKINRPDDENGFKKLCGTLAHEMQHLMNFVSSVDKRRSGSRINQMDVWIDEGLSSAAEYVYSGEHNRDRVKWFNDDPSGLIAYGNNFYVWGNYTTGNNAVPDAILDDYATVYFFFQWLRLQADGNLDIYKDIIQSSNYDYNAVLSSAKNRINNYSYTEWRYLLRNWMAANYSNASSGIYGYRGEEAFSTIRTTVFSGKTPGDQTIQLFPGEGIFTKSPNMPTAPSINIKYAGLSKTSSPNDANLSGSSAMLSYNIDTKKNGSASNAVIPLSSLDASQQPKLYMGTTMSPRGITSPQGVLPTDPYPISAGDMLTINGQEKTDPVFSLSRSQIIPPGEIVKK